MQNFLFQIELKNIKESINNLTQSEFQSIFNNQQYKISILGDCIGTIHENTNFNSFIDLPQWIIDNLTGHFYYYAINKETQSIIIGNSNFSILPIYFSSNNQQIYLSNRIASIENKLDKRSINKRFILENVLFNYPLFNGTIYDQISLLPSNSFIEINPKSHGVKSLKPIEEYFIDSPKPWKKSIENVSDLFIENSKKYFPDELYVTSLTGGFDGRTLTALGKYYNKNFTTYSFGSKDSQDIVIAARLSALSDIEFQPFELDNNFLENYSLANGLEFIEGAIGTASFARAHYLYSIKKLSGKYNYIITGNFGSEVFRAAHIAGIVISQNLYSLFNSVSYDAGILKVESSNEFQWLNKPEFSYAWESLKEDLKSLPCYSSNQRGLTKNQQFYKFVFEEVFRKYFGAEMVNQYKYVINRTPFLDFDFLKEILKTELSGVYSDYFTNNPFKRFKGQVVYANIISKTYPKFGKEYTDKGYCPNDLMTIAGKIRITQSYIKKKIFKTASSAIDPYYVNRAFSFNQKYWQSIEDRDNLFIKQKINDAMDFLTNRDLLFIVLSQMWYLNKRYENG